MKKQLRFLRAYTVPLRVFAACFLMFLIESPVESQTGKVKPSKSDVIQSFDFGDVQLLPGLMYDEFKEVKDYFMGLPDDDMLHGLRLKQGIPDPPGKAIGGWYDILSALTLPQWISSYCRMYSITGDEKCREKAEFLLDEWWKYYTSADNRGDNDKWVIALLDMYHCCGRQDALNKLDLYINNTARQLTRTADEAGYTYRALRDTIASVKKFGDNSSEWYTAAWPLYLAYMQTGRTEYKAYAGFWEYHEWWDLFAANPVKPFTKTPVAGLNSEWVHAYSHINSFNAAAEAYRVKGDEYYLNVMKNIYEWMHDYQTFATGGYGAELEHIMPINRVVATLSSRTDHFETQCGSWAALMLSQNLITLTGDAKYGNWIERLAYNAINATIPMTPETNVMYYSNYNINGATKLNRPVAGTCCAGTRPLTVIQYHINTYYHDNNNLYVNLFTPSTVKWKRGNSLIKLTQHTGFPYADTTRFTVSLVKPEKFGLGIRIPEWLASPMIATVNGKQVNGRIENGWMVIERQWNNGDKLLLTLPMNFWLSVLDKSEGRPTAVMYGPLVMAFTSADYTLGSSKYNEWWTYEGFLPKNPDKNILDGIEFKDFRNQLRPVGKNLVFQLSGNSNILLKPFMNYGKGELYYMYLER
jgi:hypothetical protein